MKVIIKREQNGSQRGRSYRELSSMYIRHRLATIPNLGALSLNSWGRCTMRATNHGADYLSQLIDVHINRLSEILYTMY